MHNPSRWRLQVDRGPTGLLVQAKLTDDEGLPETSLAKALWTLMEQNLRYHVVLELEDGNGLDRKLIRELSRLDRRARLRDSSGYVALRVPQGGDCGGLTASRSESF